MNNYETPIFLLTFFKWVLLVPYDRYEKRKKDVKNRCIDQYYYAISCPVWLKSQNKQIINLIQ